MAPSLNLRAKRPTMITRTDEIFNTKNSLVEPNSLNTENVAYSQKNTIINPQLPKMQTVKTEDWDVVDEYDPQWPNEYEKLKEKLQSKDLWEDRENRRGRNSNDERDRKRRGRSSGNTHNDSTLNKISNSTQWKANEEEFSSPRLATNKGGAAIAPPPSLQEHSLSINNENDTSSNVTIPYSASSVAAKIMAKYGFKDGQGLGKQEQGMSVALQVEKTSKRGGRIIHEKDVFLPPPPPPLSLSPAPAVLQDIEEKKCADIEPSITEIMKAPSKVVLLRNMVGPGDVDEELEPEVKDECNTKYGDVQNVLIHETFGTTPEDAVKIFVEFKRIESAIKAVVDLNGRFFGGRQVRAGFYDFDKFKKFQLL